MRRSGFRAFVLILPFSSILERPPEALISNASGQLYTTAALQYLSGEDGRKKNAELKQAIRSYDEKLYRKLGRTFAGGVTMIPGSLGRGLTVGSYRFGRKMIKF